MRRYLDPEGGRWDVVLGRESWGGLLALFVPSRAAVDVRQAPLTTVAYEEAERVLDAMNEERLHELFARSVPKP